MSQIAEQKGYDYGKRPVWQWIVIYIIIGGIIYAGIYYFFLAKRGGYNYSQSGQYQTQPTTQQASPTTSQTSPITQRFTVNANDSSADLTTIKVGKGNTVEITFNVESKGTYYGGLDFRSPVINTGTIKPGSSKTISFTSESSFNFTPYWPASNVKKPYTISVVVQ